MIFHYTLELLHQWCSYYKPLRKFNCLMAMQDTVEKVFASWVCQMVMKQTFHYVYEKISKLFTQLYCGESLSTLKRQNQNDNFMTAVYDSLPALIGVVMIKRPVRGKNISGTDHIATSPTFSITILLLLSNLFSCFLFR